MPDNITFMIIRDSGYKVNRVSISKPLIIALGLFLFIVFSTTAGFLVSYVRIKQSDAYIQSISFPMKDHRNEIETQRKQIETFKKGVASLNSNLLALVEHEGRIREITNIKKPPTG